MKHYSERREYLKSQNAEYENNIISIGNHYSKYYEHPIILLNLNKSSKLKSETNNVMGIRKKNYKQYFPILNKETEKRDERNEIYKFQIYRNNKEGKEGITILKKYENEDLKYLNKSERNINYHKNINSQYYKSDLSRNISEKEEIQKNNVDYKNNKYISDSEKNSNIVKKQIIRKKNYRANSENYNNENIYHGNAYYRRKRYWESKSNSREKELSRDSYNSLNNIYDGKKRINDRIENLKNTFYEKKNIIPFSFISKEKFIYNQFPINQISFISKEIIKIKKLPIVNLSFISKKIVNIKRIVINKVFFMSKIEKKIVYVQKLNNCFISKHIQKIKFYPKTNISFISKQIIKLDLKNTQLEIKENYCLSNIDKSKLNINQSYSGKVNKIMNLKKNSLNNSKLAISRKIEKIDSFSLEQEIFKKPKILIGYFTKKIEREKEFIIIHKLINNECYITKKYFQNYPKIIKEIIFKKPISYNSIITKYIIKKKPKLENIYITKDYIKFPIKKPKIEKKYISKKYFIQFFKKPKIENCYISKIKGINKNIIKKKCLISKCEISKIYIKVNKKKEKKLEIIKKEINKIEDEIKTNKKKTRRGGKAARRRHSNNSKNKSEQNSNSNISKNSFKSEISIEMNNNFVINPTFKIYSEDKCNLNNHFIKLPLPKKNKNKFEYKMEREVEIQIDENKKNKNVLSKSIQFKNNNNNLSICEKYNKEEFNYFQNEQSLRLSKKYIKTNFNSFNYTTDNISIFHSPIKENCLKNKFDDKLLNNSQKEIYKRKKEINSIKINNKNEIENINNENKKFESDSNSEKIILATEKLECVFKRKLNKKRNSMKEKKTINLISNIEKNNIKKLNEYDSLNKKKEEKKMCSIEDEEKIKYIDKKNITLIPKPNSMSLQFILSIKNYSNSNEIYKLPKSVLDHLNLLKKPSYNELYDKIEIKNNCHSRNKSYNKYYHNNLNDNNLTLNINHSFNKENSILNWSRKDLTKENEKAEKFIIELNNKLNENSIKHDFTSILNIVTVDNFNNIFNQLLIILKDSQEKQNQFIQVILEKSFVENNFVILYAKLCKNLCDIIGEKKQSECYLRKKLIENIKTSFDQIIQFNDNKELNLDDFYSNKKKVLGLINLIVELIDVKIISQKIGFYCINSLYEKYNESNNIFEYSFKNIYLESIIYFLSKFGKIIFKRNKNDNKNKLKNFMNNKLSKLKEENLIPLHLKYKIINLFEKEKNNWKDTLYEKSFIPKGKNYNEEEIKTSLLENDREEIIRNDLKKWINYLNENIISLENINIKTFNNYNWNSIEKLISDEKINLIEIIRCFIEVSIDLINNKDDVFKANQYIYSIIDYYSQFLNNEEIILFNNKIISIFLEVNYLIIDNNFMLQILGFLMYILINSKLFFIKDLINFIDKDKDCIINISKVVFFTIQYSGKDKKKYLNDFKQNKLYSTYKDIFNEEIVKKISE